MARVFYSCLKTRRVSGVLFLVVILILAAWMIPGGHMLTVTLVKGNKVLLALPLKNKERFTIHYYHSVENAPIWEAHSMDKKGNLYIEEERYEKFGAGMGKMPGIGHMVMQGKYEVIKDMHMAVGDFVLRVGSKGVDHTIIWRDKKFNLSNRIPHKAVQFSGKPVSLLYQIFNSPGKYLPGGKNMVYKMNDTEVENG